MKTHHRTAVRRTLRYGARLAAALPILSAAGLAAPSCAAAQDPLDELVRAAIEAHPDVAAALRRAEAARARVPQAGTLPDPSFSAGLMNVPIDGFDLSQDGMTMLSVQLQQAFLPRGLRGARQAAVEAEADAADALVEQVRWAVATRLREAYYELLLVDEAEEVHHRTHAALEAFARAAETAYVQGVASQGDILLAQTELAAIHDHLSDLRRRRAAALAEINAILDRASRTPVTAAMPRRLRALLAADPGRGLLAASLAAAELGGGFPSLAELQDRAVRNRPEMALARHRALAAGHREEAARRDRWPGISVFGGYSARSGRPDMLSFGASVDLPVFRGRKQEPALAEAGHERAGLEMEREATRLEVRREVAEAHAALVRARERLMLLDEAVIPPARAAVESAAASYGTGRSGFTGLLVAQAALYRHEIERAHLTAELGQALARLERSVGSELSEENER